MQALCTRLFTCGSRWQMPLESPETRVGQRVSAMACGCGGPLVVVDDWTDSLATARDGEIYIIDIDPVSRTFGTPIAVSKADHRRAGVRVALEYERRYGGC